MKNKGLKITSAILCLLVIIGAAIVYYLYDNGLFKPAHGYAEPKDNQIRVACVGDSVTYGMTMKHWRKNAYPFVLREMLGEDYCVENFGFSGRTVMTSGDRPFVKEKLYTQSLDFQPDIVILQIGSNDSKSYNWNTGEEFTAEYEKLLLSYINLESKPEVIIMTPPPAYSSKYGIDGEIIQYEIYPCVLDVAEKYDLEVIDLHAAFAAKPELFNDGLHPNENGAQIIAREVFEKVKD